MVLTMTLVAMSSILVGIYLTIKDRKNSIVCLLGACLFLFLALMSIKGLVGEPTETAFNINNRGEIVLY